MVPSPQAESSIFISEYNAGQGGDRLIDVVSVLALAAMRACARWVPVCLFALSPSSHSLHVCRPLSSFLNAPVCVEQPLAPIPVRVSVPIPLPALPSPHVRPARGSDHTDGSTDLFMEFLPSPQAFSGPVRMSNPLAAVAQVCQPNTHSSTSTRLSMLQYMCLRAFVHALHHSRAVCGLQVKPPASVQDDNPSVSDVMIEFTQSYLPGSVP